MGRPKKQAAAKLEEIPAEEESQEIDDDEPETPVAAAPPPAPKAAPQEAISKAEGVRRALADGLDDLDDIERFLKTRYNIQMPRQQVSSYKAQIKAKERKAGGEDTPKGKPGRKPREAGAEAPQQARTTHAANDNGDLIEDMAAVKHLVQRLGADQVRKIVGLFE